MAGNILWKEQNAAVSLAGTSSTLASGTAGLAGTLDCRAAGNMVEQFTALFTLTAQWATVTNIAAGTIVADLYLVPSLDGGTTFPDIDSSATSYIPYQQKVGNFTAPKAPTSSTDMTFASVPVDLFPVVYRVYIINRSGQTMANSWSMKAIGAAGQYT